MAITREEAFRQVIKQLKEISANIGRGGGVVVGSRQQSVNLSSVTTALNNVLAQLVTLNLQFADVTGNNPTEWLEEIEARVDGVEPLLVTIDSDTSNIRITNGAIQTLITAGNVDLAAMEVDLAAIEVLLTSLDGKDYFLSGDTTDGGDLLNELQSIDQNWNLLSVNNLALLAIADFTEDTRDNTQEIEDQLDFDQSRCVIHVADFDVTAIPGTDVVVDVVIPTGQCIMVSLRTVYTGAGTNTITLELLATNDLTKVIATIEPAFNVAANSVEHWPDATVDGSPYYTGAHAILCPQGTTLRTKWAGVAIGDHCFFSIKGTARAKAQPTVNTTATTATITTNTTIAMVVS